MSCSALEMEFDNPVIGLSASIRCVVRSRIEYN